MARDGHGIGGGMESKTNPHTLKGIAIAPSAINGSGVGRIAFIKIKRRYVLAPQPLAKYLIDGSVGGGAMIGPPAQ